MWDPLRKKEVASTPEETVRQWFIGVLETNCAVPRHMMMSEVELEFGAKKYRADIVVYGKDLHPLAIVECKREDVPLTREVAVQALRYNAVLDVPFIFLTNGQSTFAYRKEGQGFISLQALPSYKEMTLCQP